MVQLWGSCQSCRKPPAWRACWQPQPMGIFPAGQLTSSLATSCPQILHPQESGHTNSGTHHGTLPSNKERTTGVHVNMDKWCLGGLSETRGYQGVHYMLPLTRSHTVGTHLWWLTSENGQEKKGVCLEEAHGNFLGWWKCFFPLDGGSRGLYSYQNSVNWTHGGLWILLYCLNYYTSNKTHTYIIIYTMPSKG